MKKIGFTDLNASNIDLFQASIMKPIGSNTGLLVIGVGGSGVKTISSLKTELNRRFSNWDNYVKLLAVDTSLEELYISKLHQPDDILMLSCKGSALCFDITIKRDETVNDWINPNFNHGTYVKQEGSSQIRQVGISKLYGKNLNDKFNSQLLQEKIYDKINSLNAYCWNRPIQVVIVLGLAGGTGGGLVNDIAAITRLALSKVDLALADSLITGYFYLPDTVEHLVSHQALKSIEANGYAALKEIDYYYSRFQRYSDFTDRFIYPGEKNVFNIDETHPHLYNSVYLISNYSNMSDKDCRVTVVESLISMISVRKSSLFNLQVFMNKALNHRNNILSNMTKNGRDDNPNHTFNYLSLGIYTAGLPMKIIKAWSINQVVSAFYNDDNQCSIDGGFSRQPLSKEETSQILDKIIYGIDWNDSEFGIVHGDLVSKIKCLTELWVKERFEFGLRHVPYISHKDVKNETERYLFFRDVIDKIVSQEVLLMHINRMIKEQADGYHNAILNIMLQYGPFVAANIIYGEDIQNDKFVLIQAKLQRIYDDIRRLLQTAEIDKQRSLELMEDIRNRLLFDVKKWKIAYRDWLTACEIEYICKNVESSIKDLFLDPVNKLNDQIRDFTRVLESLLVIYKSAGEPLESLLYLNDYCERNYPNMLNLIDDTESYNWVTRQVADVATQNRKMEFRRAITESFKANTNEWTDDNSWEMIIKARNLFDKCIEGLHISSDLDEKLKLSEFCYAMCVAKGGDVNTEMLNYLSRITTKLIDKTKILYPQSGNSYGGKQKYILYPEDIANSPNFDLPLTQIHDQIASAAKKNDPNAEALPLEMSDKIVAYEIADALPLFSLREIENLECSYFEMVENGLIHRNESGHVDFSTMPGDNKGGYPEPHGTMVKYPNPGDAREGKFDPRRGLAWRNYPNLALRNYGNTEINNFLAVEFMPVWNQALALGIIEMQQDSGIYSYTCRVFADVNVDDYLCTYDIRDNNGLLALGKPLIDFIGNIAIEKGKYRYVMNLPPTVNGKIYELKLFESGYLSKGSDNEQIAQSNAMISLRRQVPLYVALKRTIEVVKLIHDKLKKINEPIWQQNLAILIVKAIAWSVIKLENHSFDAWDINIEISGRAENKFESLIHREKLGDPFLSGEEDDLSFAPNKDITKEFTLIAICRAFARYIKKQGHLGESLIESIKDEININEQIAIKSFLSGDFDSFKEALNNISPFNIEATKFVDRYSRELKGYKKEALIEENDQARENVEFLEYAIYIYKTVNEIYEICKELI